MSITEARKRANEKYNAKAYEQIQLRVKAGEKEIISYHAAQHGESINGFINRAIKETILRDKGV